LTQTTDDGPRMTTHFKSYLLPDFTLIASVVGENVISHGIGGNDIPDKWCNLLKASCWSKQ
jgi:hypothetical protein